MPSERSLSGENLRIVRSSGIVALCLLRIAYLWVLARVGTFIFRPFWEGEYRTRIPAIDALALTSRRLRRECERAAQRSRQLAGSTRKFWADIQQLSASGPAPVVFQITREVHYGQVVVREFEEQVARAQAAVDSAKEHPAFQPPPPVPVLGIQNPAWCQKMIPPYIAQRKEQMRQLQTAVLPEVQAVVDSVLQAFAGVQEGDTAHHAGPWAQMRRTLRSFREQLTDRRTHLAELTRQRTSALRNLEHVLRTNGEIDNPSRQAITVAGSLGLDEVPAGSFPGLACLYDARVLQCSREARRRPRQLPPADELLQETDRWLMEIADLLPQVEILLLGKQDLYCTVNPQGCDRCAICRRYHDRVTLLWQELQTQAAARERAMRLKVEKAERFYSKSVPLRQKLQRDKEEQRS